MDASALHRMSRSPDRDVWAGHLERGLLHASVVTTLEVGYSARNGADMRTSRVQSPWSLLVEVNLTPLMESRAEQVQELLADRGEHRAPSIPALLLAALAELSHLTVLHVDKDFDLIAAVTGQPVERLSV